jgi:hypothetical protein
LGSQKTTGSSSRIAARRSPLASPGVAGMTVFSPGMPVVIQYRDWECCAAERRPAPVEVRTVSGTRAFPPNM